MLCDVVASNILHASSRSPSGWAWNVKLQETKKVSLTLVPSELPPCSHWEAWLSPEHREWAPAFLTNPDPLSHLSPCLRQTNRSSERTGKQRSIHSSFPHTHLESLQEQSQGETFRTPTTLVTSGNFLNSLAFPSHLLKNTYF